MMRAEPRSVLLLSIVLVLHGVPSASAGGGSGTWTRKASMSLARQEVGAARIGDTVYVVGGLLANFTATDSVEAYDVPSNTWSIVPAMPVALDHMACAAAGGKLYVIGGFGGDFIPRAGVYAFDPATSVWTPRARLPAARGGCWAVEHEGKIYVFGGVGPPGGAQASTFVYDPVANAWNPGAPMPTPREHLNAVALGDFIYVVGGRGGGLFDANERYDPVANTWKTLAPMPTARSAMGMAAFGGRLFAMGGEIPMLHALTEVYDPATDTWTSDTPMPIPRHGIAAVTLDAGILFPGGGTVQGLAPTNAVDLFAPARLPASYCASKRNSCNRSPAIGWSGTSSAAATAGFVVAASGARPGKFGLLLYTDQGPGAFPFQGGTLCLDNQAVRRAPAVQATGGAPGACDAAFALDINAFAAGQAGGNPQAYLSAPGQRVHAQWWGRDTQAAGSFLSNGLEYEVCP